MKPVFGEFLRKRLDKIFMKREGSLRNRSRIILSASIISFFCFLSTGLFYGCSGRDASVYKCSEFWVTVPKDWKKKLDWGIFGDLVSITEPNRKASINFTIIDVPDDNSLEDVLLETVRQLHMHLLEKGYTVIDGREALWFKAIGAQQIILVHLVRKGNRVYSMLGSTLPGNFDRFKDIFVDTASSFKFPRP